MSELANFTLLRDFSGDELDLLAELLWEKQLQPDTPAFRARDEADALMLVAEGRLRITVDGRELGELCAGEALGGASLVVIGNRECDAVAVEPTRLRVLSRESYLRLRADYPGVALALQEALLRDLATLVRNSVIDRRGGDA